MRFRLHYERLPSEQPAKVIKIPVKQLGLATGRVVIVRVVKAKRIRIA